MLNCNVIYCFFLQFHAVSRIQQFFWVSRLFTHSRVGTKRYFGLYMCTSFERWKISSNQRKNFHCLIFWLKKIFNHSFENGSLTHNHRAYNQSLYLCAIMASLKNFLLQNIDDQWIIELPHITERMQCQVTPFHLIIRKCHQLKQIIE